MKKDRLNQALLERRILFVTGKGGVGKTTVAALLARIATEEGKRVAVFDIDKDHKAPSHLLNLLGGGSHFDSDGMVKISPLLDCIRLTPSGGHEQFLHDEIPVGMLARAATRSQPLKRFMMAAPGFPEMGLIYQFLHFIRKKRKKSGYEYDLLIIDLPATGHALAFTSLPETLLSVFQAGPVYKATKEAQKYFYDASTTGAVVVTLPEPLPVSETFQLLEALNRDKVPIAGVFLNLFPVDPFVEKEAEALDSFFEEAKEEMLGKWSFRRIIRANQAMGRLLEGVAERETETVVHVLSEEWEQRPGIRFEHLLGQMRELLQKADQSSSSTQGGGR